MTKQPHTYRARAYRDMRAGHQDLAEAYDALGDACRQAGPLTEREQRFVKLGVAVGMSSQDAVRSHVGRGLREGLTREEIAHAITVAIPTIGLPRSAAAYRWAEEVTEEQEAAAPRPEPR